jgi:glycerol-3-phosphate acyltransferase PlsX
VSLVPAVRQPAATRRIVVDAMGGDHAPEEPVKGAAELSLRRPDLDIVLVGDEPRLRELLARTPHVRERLHLHHASQAVGMDEKPGEALAAKPDASILAAVRLVADGHGEAVISAGNTGASVLACARTWKLIPGVRRAALAAVYPTEIRRGEKDDPFSLMLDVGATLDATADDLCNFAIMGSAYASRIGRNPRPKVALLSNGTEETKGPKEVVEAHARLKAQPHMHFIGNIEGVDIPRGTADVVVCSGFVGNVVLKMLEGVSETILRLARYAYREKLVWRAALGMLSGGIKRLKVVTDWQEYGGAPFLGFDRVFIKAHGRSGARAMSNAIKVAHRAVQSGLIQEIESRVAPMLAHEPAAHAAADQKRKEIPLE